MKVGELIKTLQGFDPNMEVCIVGHGGQRYGTFAPVANISISETILQDNGYYTESDNSDRRQVAIVALDE